MSPSSSLPSTPESVFKTTFSPDYFASSYPTPETALSIPAFSTDRNIIGAALDIYQGERVVVELENESSDITMGQKNVVDVKSNKLSVLPLDKDANVLNSKNVCNKPPARKEPPASGHRWKIHKK